VHWLLPGHGTPFTGLDARIDTILLHHERRMATILDHLKDGSQTVFDLVGKVWPHLHSGQHYLAGREVHGHLDLLVDGNRLTCSEDDGVGRFSVLQS
jgi:hypothetical protein